MTFKRIALIFAGAGAGIFLAGCNSGHMRPAASTASHPTSSPAAFVQARPAPPGAAAVVDDHIIPKATVADIAVRLRGADILDQLVGDTLINQEAKRRGIAATDAEIDQRIDAIGAMIRPKSIDDVLKARHIDLVDFRQEMRGGIEVKKLVAEDIKPVRMAHIQDIFVNISPFAGMSPNLHTKQQASKIMSSVVRDLKNGAAFEDLAKKYGDTNIDGNNGGDLGIVTNFPNADQSSIARGFSSQPAFLKACLTLKAGEIAGPVRTRYGLHLIRAISTADAPLPSEAPLYEAARQHAIDDQVSHLAPQLVATLKQRGKVTTYLGTPRAEHDGIAASVNGETIPLSHVADIAVASVGPMIAQRLVDQALVDEEARKRSITIASSQLNADIDKVIRTAKPAKLDTVLRQGRMTQAEFRASERGKLEAEAMVAESVGVIHAAHIRDISLWVKRDADTKVGHSETEAQSIMRKTQARVKSGEPFEDLAKEYSENQASKSSGGDLGIITEDAAIEPSFVKAAMHLKSGEVADAPIRTSFELHLIKAVSTSDQHPATEDEAYRHAIDAARQREVQSRLPGFIKQLRAHARIVNYLQ